MTSPSTSTPPMSETDNRMGAGSLAGAGLGASAARSSSPRVRGSRRRRQPDPAVLQATAERAIRSVVNRHELATRLPLPRSIAVVAALPGDGVSTMAKALVHVLASDFEARVCLIDLDRSRADPEAQGDRAVLTAGADLRDVLSGKTPVELFLEGTEQRGVYRLAVDEVFLGNTRSIARSVEFEELFKRILTDLDFIVFDTPALQNQHDALALLRHADAYLLVARHGHTTLADVRNLTSQLASIPAIGGVLNDTSTRTPRYIRRLFDG